MEVNIKVNSLYLRNLGEMFSVISNPHEPPKPNVPPLRGFVQEQPDWTNRWSPTGNLTTVLIKLNHLPMVKHTTYQDKLMEWMRSYTGLVISTHEKGNN